MRELFDKYIEWEKIGGKDRDLRYEILGACVSKDGTALTVKVGLNFVMPYDDVEKVKEGIMKRIPELRRVRCQFTYQKEAMVMEPEEQMKYFILHMIQIINGKYATLTGNIIPESARIRDDLLNISTLGRMAADRLNSQVAPQFASLIREHLGHSFRVRFINDEEMYDKARSAFEAAEEGDIRASVEEEKERASENGEAGENAAPRKSFQSTGSRKGRKKEAPAQGSFVMGGRGVSGRVTDLSSLAAGMSPVTVEGTVFKKEARTTRNGRTMVTLLITDKKTSACLKCFVSAEKWKEIDSLLSAGDYIKAEGEVEEDAYEHCPVVMVKVIEKGQIHRRQDTCQEGKRVELHAHTKMSAMDGLNDTATLVETAAAWGQPAVAITDHGVVQSFTDAANTADKLAEEGVNIKIIYGMEGYVFDDRDCRLPDGAIDYKKKPTNHIILLAKSQEGIKNIYKLVSLSHLNYFYKKPRLPKSVIREHREGIIIGSACEAGEVYRAVLAGLPEDEIEEIAGFYDYLEIQPLINNRFMVENGTVNGNEDLMELNRRILALGDKLGKPVVATTDAHYDEPESAIYRNILMAGMGYKDAENGQGLYMRTTDEMMEEFSYLGERAREVVVDNTNLIASMIDDGIRPVPKGKFPPKIEGAEKTLMNTCMERAYSIYGNPLPEPIGERLEKELNSIIRNGYAVMYVSAQMLVNKSLQDGYLVGSRGSVGSSFAATMAGITEVNPLDPHYICPNCHHLEWGDKNLYDCGIDMPEKDCPQCGTPMKRDGFTIPFATFLGFEGEKEPDIDLNFAGEYQATAHKYVGTIFGEKNVFKAGTVGTVADKTAYGYVRRFFEETQRSENKFEIDRLTAGCTGVKKTTGQHPGGIIIVPDDHEIYEFCPVQHPANDMKSDIITTHFDYHKIDQNLLKLDILGHDVPSMIRQLQDMTGVDPLTVDLTDGKVLSIFNGVEALDIKDPDYRFTHGSYGIPEFGTSFVRQMLDDTKPDKFADLVRISGFSHGTDVWLNNAQDYIRNGTATMREVISTRDDIMNYLILKGIENKTAFQIMEDVRKNKPLNEEQLRVMKDHGVPDWYIDSCIKIQYMFPRAHAVAYVMMSFRMAWYKVYYPAEFYATYFTSKAADFEADTILKGSGACLDRIDEIAAKGNNATAKESSSAMVMEVAYEMYSRGYRFEKPCLEKSHGLKFWIEDGKLLLPFIALEGVGEGAAKALEDGYREKPFDTIEEAVNRAKLNKTATDALRSYGVFDGLPETDQMSFFTMGI